MGFDVYGIAWATAVHQSIARAILAPTLSPQDVSSILGHALAGKDEQLLIAICSKLVVGKESRRAYGWLTWFLWIKVDGFTFWFTKLVVRILQFAIAAESEQSNAIEFAEKLERESRIGEDADPANRAARFMAICTLLRPSSARLPVPMIVSAAIELDELSSVPEQLAASVPKSEDHVLSEMPADFDAGSAIVAACQARIETYSDFAVFIHELAKLSPRHRSRLTARMANDPAVVMYLVNAAWLHEWHSETPEWDALLITLRECLAIVLDWGDVLLAAAIGTVLVRTVNDNLRRPIEAREFGSGLVDRVGEFPELVDAIADTLDAEGRQMEALEMRQRVLSRWLPTVEDALGPIIGRRKAAISAANADQWATAAELLLEAATFAPPEQLVLKVGLLFDGAYAGLMARNGRIDVDQFLSAIDQLRSIPNVREEPRAFRLHKVVGNMLTVLAAGTNKGTSGTDLAEITPGCCSDFSVHDELLALPTTQIEFTLLNLCRYCIRTDQVSPIILQVLRDLRTSDLTFLRVLSMGAEAQLAVTSGNVDAVPQLALAFSRVLIQAGAADANARLGASSPPASESDPADVHILLTFMVSALLVQVESGGPISLPATWCSGEARPVLPESARDWIVRCESVFALPFPERAQWVGKHANPYELGAAVLSLSRDPALDSKFALRAHIHLVRLIQSKSLISEVSPNLSRLICVFWRKQALNRFSMVDPESNQPDLLEACALPREGLAKSAAVLLSAARAFGLQLPVAVSEELIAVRQTNL